MSPHLATTSFQTVSKNNKVSSIFLKYNKYVILFFNLNSPLILEEVHHQTISCVSETKAATPLPSPALIPLEGVKVPD